MDIEPGLQTMFKRDHAQQHCAYANLVLLIGTVDAEAMPTLLREDAGFHATDRYGARTARICCAFDMASGSEIFWTALSEGPVGLELRGAVSALSFSCYEAHPERPEE
jgi:hypothetical protein